MISFLWHKGMSAAQKKKNVAELHRAAADLGIAPVLEVSTKSEEPLGRRLSAFSLKIALRDGRQESLESTFQSSKVFENGGPFTDLLRAEPRDAKRDERLVSSGKLVSFQLEGRSYPLEPKTAFYDWLYLRAVTPHEEYLRRLRRYAAFSDIEFNPERSLNCQARSCATFVVLESQGLVAECARSFERFVEVLTQRRAEVHVPEGGEQLSLFPGSQSEENSQG
ncbi:MAG: hypothetical protein KJ058_18880 [Thermoanaerobaculia bacterium]|nr:hypothetical protein [Thermoanaerobaculia bacterium]